MFSLLACIVAAQAPIDQPPRLRTQLPNGALILVERAPGAASLVIDLFVSSRDTEDTPDTQGRRHLLEHLAALGPDGKLDLRLETAGGFLTARTLRDCTEFDLVLPSDGLKTGISALKALLALPQIDAGAIARESRIIEEEGALREDGTRASAAAWSFAFGANGLDPFGSLDVIRSTTPDDLIALHRRSYVANHLAVVVSGNVDLDGTTRAIADVLSLIPVASDAKPKPPAVPAEGKTSADVRGEYRAVGVSGFRSPRTAATVAAALALSLDMAGGSIIYTPSARPGLVILGSSERNLAGRLLRSNAAQLFTVGRLAALRWVNSQMSEPQTAASCRGMLLVSERDVRPETMIENLNALRYEEFRDAVEAFKSHCVTVEGSR